MSAHLADLVEGTITRLRDDRGVDAGLEVALQLAREHGGSKMKLVELQGLLKQRYEAVENAAIDVRRLLSATSRIRKILPFTEDGWPDEEARFRQLADTDPEAAVATWLRFLDEAAAGYRLEALGRLVSGAALPVGCDRLRERAAACLFGLRERRYPVVAAVLGEGARHPATGPVDGAIARDLRLLLARLAVTDASAGEVDAWLDGSAEGAAYALRAAAARAAGDDEEARRLLSQARGTNPRDLDVVSELVRQALQDGDFADARQLAQMGVAALPSLVDVEHDIGKLLEAPSELWLAVAVRAREEGFDVLADDALRMAQRFATGGPNENRIAALVADSRAEEAQGLERVEHLSEAGKNWASQGDLATARDRFAVALQELDRSDDEALWASLTLGWADCANILALREPATAGSVPFRHTLELTLAAMAVPGVTDDLPWSRAVEWDARSVLAQEVDEPRSEHQWRGLVAAARAVAALPDSAAMWASLADAAGYVGFRGLTLAAGREAEQRGSDPSLLARWAAASGEYDVALDRLREANDPWSVALNAEVHLHRGRVGDAVRTYSSVTLDPSWTGAMGWHVLAAAQLEGMRSARSLAEQYLNDSPEDVTDFAGLVDRGLLAVFAGRLEQAEAWLRRAYAAEISTDQGLASFWLGVCAGVAGRAEESARLIGAAMRKRDRAYLVDWRIVERPALIALTDIYDGSKVSLEAADEVVAERLDQLHGPDFADPGAAVREGVPEEVIAEALSWVGVLSAVASGEMATAREKLGRLPAGQEVAVLLWHVDVRLAREVVEPLVRPSGEPWSADQLESLVGVGTEPLVQALYDVTMDGGTDAAAVEAIQQALLSRSDASPEATAVLEELSSMLPGASGGVADDEKLLFYLPWSWFQDHDDPTQTHPIFQRHLPELRDRDPGVPPVNVVGDGALEPDYWAVVSPEGEELLSGEVVMGARACRPEEWEVLPERLRAVEPEVRDGWHWIPEDAFDADDRVARLLTMDVEEFVVRQLSTAVAPVGSAQPSEALPQP